MPLIKRLHVECFWRPGLSSIRGGTAVDSCSGPVLIHSRGCLEGCVEKAQGSPSQVPQRVAKWEPARQVGATPGLSLSLKAKHGCLHKPSSFLNQAQSE